MLLVKLINGIRQMQSQYETLQPAQAREFVQANKPGDYTLLDVREDWEYEEARIPGALHIPLSQLDDRMDEVPKDKPVAAYCRAGGRSAAAASMLKGREYPVVYNIMGGMDAWEGDAAAGAAQAGLAAFPPGAGVQDIIAMACRMEVHLGAFYLAMADKPENAEAADTLKQLAGFEDKHKTHLMIIYKRMTGEDLDKDFLTRSLSDGDKPLEGGLTADEFMEINSAWLDTPTDVIETGMMFEAQALDLYMRYSREVEDAESKELLQKLAREEKGHLKALAELLKRVGG